MRKIRVGINGFGRIGKAFTRINLIHNEYEIVAINDIDPNIHNHAYLLKYDTTYGKLKHDKVAVNDDHLIVNGHKIKIFCENYIRDVPWESLQVDVVIDSSGVYKNVINAKEVIGKNVKKIIITHAPKDGVDFTLMYGVNHNLYDGDKHHIISSSICDANAVAPFYKVIDDAIGVESGEITTLHPWLSYQNLLDGSVQSVDNPGHFWDDFALGRSSIGSLIPKKTTLCNALEKVLPGIKEKVHATSFRTPTSIVSAADGVLLLKESTSIDHINNAIKEYCYNYPNVLYPDNRSLVSIDYLGNENAAVIDTRWTYLNKGKMLKFVLWYDNEWGYTKRTYDLISTILQTKKTN